MALAQLDPSASHPQPSLIAHQRAHTALATHAQIASDTAAARAAAVARTFHESGTHHFHTTYGSHHHQDVLFHSVTDTTANTTFAIDTPAQSQRGKDIAASALTKLFGQRPVNHFAQDRLLSHLDTSITTEAATAMGSPLTLSDMHNAARALQRNKSPGLDGIPVEAYLALWEVFGQVLTNAFNACHQASPCCLSPRQRTSDYTLIPKATTPSAPAADARSLASIRTSGFALAPSQRALPQPFSPSWTPPKLASCPGDGSATTSSHTQSSQSTWRATTPPDACSSWTSPRPLTTSIEAGSYGLWQPSASQRQANTGLNCL